MVKTFSGIGGGCEAMLAALERKKTVAAAENGP